MIGQVLSHYHILDVLGHGGMGVVYRAHDERLDRDVALKVLSQGSLGDETARKRLRREALLLSKLSHPHICTIFDFDSQDGVDFLVMELVSGESLAARLRRGALSESEILPIGIQIAEALDEAHQQGVVHRDLKPGNVMIMTRGAVKVLDFGIARSVEQESVTMDNLTGTGMIAGTLPYMAPELFQGSDADARTDIYAWGAVAYELATGVRPFAQSTPASLVQAILHQPPTPPTTLVPELSPGFEDVILKALQKDRGMRHASAGEVVAALRDMGGVRGAPAPRRASRGRRWPAIAASVVGALLLAVALSLLTRSWKVPFGASPGIRSLAVLPLANLSGDPSQDYFADGMTDALITRLAQIHDLRVISRTSVDRYRKAMKSLPEIGRELHVQAIVEGSVLRSGDRVRITAQLVDASKDQHLWANDYERDLSDVIALQSDLVGAIASQIQARLTPGERAGLTHIDVVKSDAYDDYLKGRYHSNRRTKEDLEAARALFQRAIENDPGFALAHAGLADTYILLHLYAGMSATEAFPLAMGAARRALALNENLAEAYPAIALVKIYSKWDWDGAESDFKRGIRLNPSYATAYHWYSILLRDRGRFDEAITAARHALELDPLSLIVNANLGDAYFFARRFDDAIRQHRAGRDLDPGFPPTHLYLGMAFAQSGQIDSALTECRTARALAGDGDFGLGGLGYVLGRAGHDAEARDVLRRLEQKARDGAAVSFDIGLVQVGLGNRAAAIEWLGRACVDQPSGIKDLGVDPRLDPLRKDRGFGDLLRRTRLDQNRM